MKKKKEVLKNTFEEAYTIKGTYQKEDGFWTTIKETQLVDVVHGINEKDNHEQAEELFREQNKHLKNLKIHAINYQ